MKKTITVLSLILAFLTTSASATLEKTKPESSCALPKGPYLNSCKYCSLSSDCNTLTCDKCRYNNYYWNYSPRPLNNVEKCHSGINNCNSVLKCGGC